MTSESPAEVALVGSGRIGGIVRVIEDGRDCKDVTMQVAAATKSLDRTGFKIVIPGMRQCLDVESNDPCSEAQIVRMEKDLLSLA